MSFCNFRVFRVKEYCGCFMPKMPRVRHESRGIMVEQIDHYGGSYGPFPPTKSVLQFTACKEQTAALKKAGLVFNRAIELGM